MDFLTFAAQHFTSEQLVELLQNDADIFKKYTKKPLSDGLTILLEILVQKLPPDLFKQCYEKIPGADLAKLYGDINKRKSLALLCLADKEKEKFLAYVFGKNYFAEVTADFIDSEANVFSSLFQKDSHSSRRNN